MRAFSLAEAMIVVAILGVVAALAVPSLLPEVHKAQLDGAAEGAAAFLARARAEAMRSKRCVRVTAVPPATLVAERFNTFDCEAPNSAPLIDTAAPVFVPVDRFTPESPNVALSFTTVPAAPGGGALVFRPNGRVFSNDVVVATGAPVLTNDDAVVQATHGRIAAAEGFRRVLVEGNGLICTFRRGVVPPGAAPDFTCP